MAFSSSDFEIRLRVWKTAVPTQHFDMPMMDTLSWALICNRLYDNGSYRLGTQMGNTSDSLPFNLWFLSNLPLRTRTWMEWLVLLVEYFNIRSIAYLSSTSLLSAFTDKIGMIVLSHLPHINKGAISTIH
jgi:hypothetical protein